MSGGNNFHQRIGGADLEENKILIHFTEPKQVKFQQEEDVHNIIFLLPRQQKNLCYIITNYVYIENQNQEIAPWTESIAI